MNIAAKEAIKSLVSQSQPIGEDNDEIEQVATISANGDTEIGKHIAEAMGRVKKEGIITIGEAKGTETTIDIVEGMQFNRGYLSPYFITDTEKMEITLEKTFIVICNEKITDINDILSIIEFVAEEEGSLLIIAEDVSGEALSTLIMNKIDGRLKAAVVRAPEFGEHRKLMLEDIATTTGGVSITPESGFTLKTQNTDSIGFAHKVIITRDNTTIIGGAGDDVIIKEKANEIKAHIVLEANDYVKSKLQERLAKLISGVAIINIGAATEIEMKEKKDRAEDALNATKAAIEEGIIPGGGTAYIKALKRLDSIKPENEDQLTGVKIVCKALEAPLRQIISNTNKDSIVYIDGIKKSMFGFGYNAKTEEYENLIRAGIIDPTKVARVALESAVSVASMLLTTEAIVIE